MDPSNECEECGKVFTDSARLFTHQKKSCRAGKRSLRELLSDARDLWKVIESRPRKRAKLSQETQTVRSKSSTRKRSHLQQHHRHLVQPLASGSALEQIVPMEIETNHGLSDTPLPDQCSSSENSDRTPELRRYLTSKWTTLRNGLGLFKQFKSAHPPSHNPDALTDASDPHCRPSDTTQPTQYNGLMQPGICTAPSTNPQDDLDRPSTSCDSSNLPYPPAEAAQFYPYPNWSSFELGDLFWSHGPTNSLGQFGKLISLLNNPNFSLEDVQVANWASIHHSLADGEPPELDSKGRWVDDCGPGWRTTEIALKVPFPTRGQGYLVEVYKAGVLHHRKIVSVIKEKIMDPAEHRNRHFRAHELFWQPDLTRDPIRVYGEVYSSEEFSRMEDEVQGLVLDEEDQGLERVVIALMFWTDATLLANFGTAKLWPCYMFFGNDPKYFRAAPSANLCNHIAYFESLPASFKDWYRSHNEGRNPTQELVAHCVKEIFHRQWDILLDDELVQAMKKGIRITCLDGATRLFFPRIFTYSADYPEKATIATIKNMGTAPCPRCYMKKCEMHGMGSEEDSSYRTTNPRIDNAMRQEQVRLAKDLIFGEGYVVNSKKVDGILKDDSMLPIDNAFTKLSPLGFDIHSSLAVDLMHEFELGVWKAIFIHLVRILEAADRKGEGPTVSELDRRYRHIPPFGPDTIRKFGSNASEQKKLAARDYANLLQCAIPAFDRLLLTLAEWHALAKLRMHTEPTVKLLETKTTELANRVQNFMNITCQAYETVETTKEYGARLKRSAKKDKKANPPNPTALPEEREPIPSSSTLPPQGSTLSQAGPVLDQPSVQPELSPPTQTASRKGKLRKTLNIQTYKYHALADYARHIRRFGTTDSYSTERGELEHQMPKSWFPRTNKKAYQRQLARIERRRAALRKIRQNAIAEKSESSTSRKKAIPMLGLFCSYVVAKSQSSHLPLHHFVPREVNDHDPALKGFLTSLQEHLGGRLEVILRRQNPERLLDEGGSVVDPNYISVVDGRIYTHQTLHLNYTTYDGREGDDIIWPSGSKADIMLLNPSRSNPGEHLFVYGKVLGIYHANVVYVKGCQDLRPEHLAFLWVRWYQWQGQSTGGLDLLNFPPVTQPGAFGFLDPGDVLRACYIIPRLSVSSKRSHESISESAQDVTDHAAYFANRFADRDMFMRYLWGYAVGHSYTHGCPPLPDHPTTPPPMLSSQPEIAASMSLPARAEAAVPPSQTIPTSFSSSHPLETQQDVLHGIAGKDPALMLPLNPEDEMVYERSDIEDGSSDEEAMSGENVDSEEE